MTRAVRAALAAATLAAAPCASAGVAESWYLARGRANMKIDNYAAAIEAYESALRANPRSREASRGVGVARLRNGETDRAVADFDRHLAAFPDDADIAFEQARILQWSRYAYRSRDAIRYLGMGLALRDDPARRRELARLLGRDRATLDEALAEYERLLRQTPGDAALREERLRLLLWDPRHRDAAVRELEARVREHPDDEQALRELARLGADDPARAGEAAARYELLLARHPEDPGRRLGHARALARAGRRGEAREAYARAVALRPTAEARLERADLLASHPGSREEARAEYEAVLRASPRSRRARLGLARVLMARKETSPTAAALYREVLVESPREAEAHRGLARAYAWNGDADRALAHGALAERYGRSAPDVAAMERSLRRGREPTLGGGGRVLAQPGGAFAVRSLSGHVSGSADPTPFTSSEVEGGLVLHRGGGSRAEGTSLAVAAEWRPGPSDRLRGGFAWDGARLAGHGAGGELRWEREGEGRILSLRAFRTPRRDSFRALAGEVLAGAAIGAASDNAGEVRLVLEGERDRVELSARAGAVTGAGFAADFTAGATARADRVLLRHGPWTLLGGASAEAMHHARDLSGLSDGDPLAPRLFSPPLFVTASPRFGVVRETGPKHRIALDMGPALQLTAGPAAALRAGGDFRVSVARHFGDRIRLAVEERGELVAGVYRRFEFTGTLAILF